MNRRGKSAPNRWASAVALAGVVLLLAGGISAYPTIREWLGLDVPPANFGDEAALSKAIVNANESLPKRTAQPAPTPDSPAPVVLPETPLQADATPTPIVPAIEPTPTSAPTTEPTPTVELAPTVEPTPIGAPIPTATEVAGFEPGRPTRIVIPAITLDAPVEEVSWSIVNQGGQQVSMWNVPNRRAAGWLKTTAPVGQPGNTVLDGHHNINGEVFRDLVTLKPGDTIQMWAGDRPRDYVVTLRKILPEKGQPLAVRLENAKWIQPTSDERVTLVTCWPYTNNTHRLIIVARPAPSASVNQPSE